MTARKLAKTKKSATPRNLNSIMLRREALQVTKMLFQKKVSKF